MKIFGNSKKAAFAAVSTKKKKVKKPLKTLAIFLTCLLLLEGAYFFCMYTTNEFVSYWRTVWINTAFSTMRHQWLATKLMPKDVVQQVIDQKVQVSQQAAGKASTWGETAEKENRRQLDVEIRDTTTMTEEEIEEMNRDKFYSLYWELDQATMEAYLAEHPEALDNGWDHIYINEAGLDDSGTSIYTVFGEQVLAIDSYNSILLLRVTGDKYRGVLAVGKNPELLNLEWAAGIGKTGSYVGDIAQRTKGLIALTGSGFIDEDAFGNQGNGNGGILSGYAMCNGVAAQGRASKNVSWHNFVRLELHEDNLMYIRSIDDPVSEDCTDAMEFEPAMIVDGEVLVSNWWIEMNPRTAIGQSDKYEFLMLAIEGRNPAAGIIGTDINECADILKRHNCMQAINLDGGASMIMWYDGEYVVRCGNLNLPKGRTLPNAFVYHSKDWLQ